MVKHWLETAATDVEKWFTKFWKAAPAWNVKALSLVNMLGPDTELVLSLVDPEAEKVAAPIITEVQSDMGTIATMLKNGQITNLPTFVASVKANLGTLLSEGHIKNPDSVAKATGIVSAISTVLNGVLQMIPAAA